MLIDTARRALSRLLPAVALAATVMIPSAANAAHISAVHTDVGPIITLTGEIVSGDYERFEEQLQRFPEARIVYMQSEGGDVSSALNIGKAMHERQMRAVVRDRDYCLSACALAWLGSPSRTLFSNSQVGFHAAWRPDGIDLVEDAVGNAMIGHYINSLGLSVDAVVFATHARPDRLAYIPTQHSSWQGIDFIVEDAPKHALHRFAGPVRRGY